jgi:predicted RNA polymerase sigma factor
MNRAVAVLKVNGAEKAIAELEKIENISSLRNYHLFYSTKAEFYIQAGKYSQAADCLRKSIGLSPLAAEKLLLQKKLDFCIKKIF